MKAILERAKPSDEMGQNLVSAMPEENLLQDFTITIHNLAKLYFSTYADLDFYKFLLNSVNFTDSYFIKQLVSGSHLLLVIVLVMKVANWERVLWWGAPWPSLELLCSRNRWLKYCSPFLWKIPGTQQDWRVKGPGKMFECWSLSIVSFSKSH